MRGSESNGTMSTTTSNLFDDCVQVQKSDSNAKSGVYLMSMDPSGNPFSVAKGRCYLEDEDKVGLGGGWTVIQRRGQFGNEMDFFNRVSF